MAEEKQGNVIDLLTDRALYETIKNYSQDVEALLEKLEGFKEKTGLDDDDVQAIIDGGEFKTAMKPELDSFYQENHFTREEYIPYVLDQAINAITSDETVALLKDFEESTKFSPQDTAKLLAGTSAELGGTLEELLKTDYTLRDLRELQSEAGMTPTEIVESLNQNINRDSLFLRGEWEESLSMEIMSLHVDKLGVALEDEIEEEVESPKEIRHFRDLLNAQKATRRDDNERK